MPTAFNEDTDQLDVHREDPNKTDQNTQDMTGLVGDASAQGKKSIIFADIFWCEKTRVISLTGDIFLVGFSLRWVWVPT